MRIIQASLTLLVSLCLASPAWAGQAAGRAKGHMKRPKSRVVTLTITSSPEAGVTVGGSFRGRTPLTLKVSPGSKRITLETRAGQREVRTINAKPGETLTINHNFPKVGAKGGEAAVEDKVGNQTPYLEALKRQQLGAINVSSSVPGRLFVDGNDTTRMTPVTDLEATPGSHRLKLMFVTGGEKEIDIRVTAGERTKVTFTP